MGLSKILEGGDEGLINKKIMFIDLYNLIFRNLHVAHLNDPTDDEFIAWKHMMIHSILNYLKIFKPDLLVIVSDEGSSWRKKIYPEYKSNRKDIRDKSTIDFEKFFKISNKFIKDLKDTFTNIYFLGIDGIEADDIIAVLVKEFLGNEIINVSSDKDFYQLYRYKGYSQYNAMQKKIVEVLNPEKFLKLKIMTGDSSDNIPNIKKRMGVKTAEKWVNKLDLLFEESGNEVKENYLLNKRLIDFEMIPLEYQNKIKEEFYSYEIKEYDGRKVYNFISNNLPKLIDSIQDINNQLRDIKGFEEIKNK